MPFDALGLLLCYGDTGAPDPVLGDGLPLRAVESVPDPLRDGPGLGGSRRIESETPDDLTAQRWGVVAPAGALGDRLLAAVAPLLKLRQEQQGGAPPVLLRAPAVAQLGADDAQRWRDTVYDELDLPPEERLPAEDQPQFLLVLGDLHQVPETIHQVLSTDCYVGRLAFSLPDGGPDCSRYEAYVEKVLRYERGRAAGGHEQARLFVVEDGTAATSLGRQAMIEPLASLLARDADAGRLSLPANSPTPERFQAIAEPAHLLRAAAQAAGVMLSVSHGSGPPRGGWESGEQQRRLQGAMQFGRAGRLTGEDVASVPFIPGGVWVMFACYGAGTPASSQFHHWLEALQRSDKFSGNVAAVLAGLPKPEDRPFIAALPQSLLSSPQGPLAFIGHLDLAWTYSFMDAQGGPNRRHPERFLGLLKALLRRHRVGVALRELARHVTSINAQLARSYNQAAQSGKAPDPGDVGHLWMVRQDLQGHVLLGDPAVTLPMPAEPPPISAGAAGAARAAAADERAAPPAGAAAG